MRTLVLGEKTRRLNFHSDSLNFHSEQRLLAYDLSAFQPPSV